MIPLPARRAAWDALWRVLLTPSVSEPSLDSLVQVESTLAITQPVTNGIGPHAPDGTAERGKAT